jgi:DNA-binding SARP family transcriptional activator
MPADPQNQLSSSAIVTRNHTERRAFPVQIFALSRFTVLVDEERLCFAHKAQNRPLDLLKVLIALGGRDVPESRAIDALWPDLDADAGERALSAALHRLRRLLGRCTAVLRCGRCLTLDSSCVWVDAWAFERGLSAAQAAPVTARAPLLVDALRHYQRPLLWGEQAPWADHARERLRWKAITTTIELCRSLATTDSAQAISELYLAMIDAEPGEERLYTNLLEHFGRVGATEELVALYRRGVRALRAAGPGPSPHYEATYRSLLSSPEPLRNFLSSLSTNTSAPAAAETAHHFAEIGAV